MVGFKTKSSTYYVDTYNCLIWGGKLGNNTRRYIQYKIIIGCVGEFVFDDGGRMTTGVIEKYI